MLRPLRLREEDRGGRLEVRGEAGVGRRLDVGGDVAPAAGSHALDRDVLPVARDVHPDLGEGVQEGAEVRRGGAAQGDLPARDGGRDRERAGLDAVGDDVVRGAPQAAPALDLDDVRGRALHLGAHGLEEVDEVVDLGLARRRPDDRVAVGQRGGEHGVLGAHDRDVREVDPTATQPTGRLREVVAVAIADGGAERLHRVDVQVHRTPADAIAPGIADDDAAESRQQRAEEDEAGAHLGGRLERHEEPVDVAGRDLVDVSARGGRRRRRGRAGRRP